MRFHCNTNASSSKTSSSCLLSNLGWYVVMVGIYCSVQRLLLVVNAQVPANDLCINAQTAVIAPNYVITNHDMRLATVDLDVVDDCITGQPPQNKGIWFNVTGSDRPIITKACHNVYSAPTATKIIVYTGGCNPTSRVCVAATVSGCSKERFFFNTTMGTEYHILVQYDEEYYPNLTETIDVAIFEDPPRGNDLCENAQPIAIDLSPAPTRYDMTWATLDLDVADDCITGQLPKKKGIWFNITGNGRRMVARACSNVYASSVYGAFAVISVFTSGCSLSTRKCIAATERSCGSERFFFNTTLGVTYHVLVQTDLRAVDVSIFEAPSYTGNDFCENAQPIAIGSDPIPARFDTTYATQDDVFGWGLRSLPPCLVNRYKGIWFKITGTGGYIVAEANNVPPPCFLTTEDYGYGLCDYISNVIVSVFKGGCSRENIYCYADSNDFSYQINPVVFRTTLGTEYHLLVQTPMDAVDVAIFEEPPSNDRCENAQPVVIGSNDISMPFDISYATVDQLETLIFENVSNYVSRTKGIWFNFTGTGGGIVARAGNDLKKSSCGCSNITVYTGGCELSTRQLVAIANGGCERKRFIFNTTVDVEYHVLVQRCDNEGKAINVSIFEPPPPTAAPTYSRPSCGLFGFNVFCPQRGKCGFFRRLFGIHKCE